MNIGGHEVPRVFADISHLESMTPATLFACGYTYNAESDKWNISDQACDYIVTGNMIPGFDIPGTLGVIVNASTWNEQNTRHFPLFTFEEFHSAKKKSKVLNFVKINLQDIFGSHAHYLNDLDSTIVLVILTNNEHGMAEQRRSFIELNRAEINSPVIIKRAYPTENVDELSIHASTDAGALFLDGFGDGIWINAPNVTSRKQINSTAFGILQATRTRISKTEYISCPSCGRTLFDLQETTAKIRSRTDHLKGIKIGIMGCIVNGPGEMADADYGYVGTGVGKITLYKGREVVSRNIDSENAVDQLIDLIKEHGDWVEGKV